MRAEIVGADILKRAAIAADWRSHIVADEGVGHARLLLLWCRKPESHSGD